MLKRGNTLNVATLMLMIFGVSIGLQSTRGQLKLGGPASITIHIVDSYGKPVKYKVEHCHAIDQPNVELAGQFQGLTFKGAVQGKTYEFRLVPLPQGKEFPAFKQQITVGEASTLAVYAV